MLTIRTRRRAAWRPLAVLGGILAFAGLSGVPGTQRPAATAEAHTIQDALVTGLQDLSLTTQRRDVNMGELNKIGRDFANAYRVGRSRIRIKEPGRFRMDAKVGPLTYEYIICGPTKVTRGFLVNERREIGTDPGKRQGPMEVGLITPGALVGFTAEHVSCGEEAGRPACCYRLRYVKEPARHELVWVDWERRCILKRELFTLVDGKLKMKLIYKDPQKVGPVWVPTRIEVYNAQGKRAGVTEQSDIQVNTGLPDSLFRL